jgi:hypothetical protein
MPQTSSDEFVPWDMTQAHSILDLETSGGSGSGTNVAAATPTPGVDLSGFTPESVDRHEAAFRLDLDDAPFVPPGMDHLPEAHEDTATDLPKWLEGLTPSVPVSAEPAQSQDQFSPYNMSDFGGQPNYGQQPQSDYGQQPFNMQPDYSQQPDNVFTPAGMMGGQGGPGDMGPMGPYGEMQLPNPHDLPGGQDGLSSSSGFGGGPGYNQPQGQSGQPWYLQPSGSSSTATAAAPGGQGNKSYAESSMLSSAMLSSTMLTSTMVEEQRGGKPVATIPCPNCTQQVPETSLACPQCRYSFFVNCPLCHELVDTSDAKAGQTEACPYCKQTINKMEMGMGGVSDLVSQKNPGSRPAAANAMAYPSMQQTASPSAPAAGGLSFNWVVDLMWLCVVVLIVWALTQLPTWLNLPGMY